MFLSQIRAEFLSPRVSIEKLPRTPRKKRSRTEKDWRISNISKWLLFSSSSAIATGPPCIDATLAGRHARHFSTSVYTWSVFCLDDVDTVSTLGATRVYRVCQKYVLIPLIPLYIYILDKGLKLIVLVDPREASMLLDTTSRMRILDRKVWRVKFFVSWMWVNIFLVSNLFSFFFFLSLTRNKFRNRYTNFFLRHQLDKSLLHSG